MHPLPQAGRASGRLTSLRAGQSTPRKTLSQRRRHALLGGSERTGDGEGHPLSGRKDDVALGAQNGVSVEQVRRRLILGSVSRVSLLLLELSVESGGSIVGLLSSSEGAGLVGR